MTVCLDSWAVLRWMEGQEPAASAVDEVLDDRPVMSWINLGEVFYVVTRSEGVDRAEIVIASLRGALRMDDATPERVLDAASIKAAIPMAYADAFALATARAHDATLFTGDPEIIDADTGVAVRDLRPT